MKAINFLILIIFFSFKVSAQTSEKVNWLTFDEALKLNAVAPRKILVDMYTDWCGWCKTMDRETFGNPIIARYINQHFYAIKFNADSKDPITIAGLTFIREGRTHQFVSALGVSGYPTVVYFTSDLKLIGPIPGFYKPEKMEPLLHFIANDKFTSVTWDDNWAPTLEQFEKTFVGEIKKR